MSSISSVGGSSPYSAYSTIPAGGKITKASDDAAGLAIQEKTTAQVSGLEAGKDYYIFSQNAQVGFQGFEFTTGGTDGIENVQVVKVQNNKIYNLQGQVVGDDYKGIVIKNGKKFLKK